MNNALCPVSEQTPLEELANCITHGLGLVLSLAGLIVLVLLAWIRGTLGQVIGMGVYGMSLVLLYAVSTIYHASRRPTVKRLFRRFDHAAIFFLIAGSCTPFGIESFGGTMALIGVWLLALLGAVAKIRRIRRSDGRSTLMYLALGWLSAAALIPVLRVIPIAGVIWLVAGGVVYSLGTPFYLWKKLPYNHAVWHLFVMAGSACHFVSICYAALPR